MTLPAGLDTRTLDLKVAFRWDGLNWTDETGYFIRATAKFAMSPPNEPYLTNRQIIQEMTLTLSNKDNRYSPGTIGSVVNAYAYRGGAYHVKVRLQVQVDSGDWGDVFVGFVKWPSEDLIRNTVDFRVWDVGEILRKKQSTPILTNYKEHDLVIYYLTNIGGLVDGTDYISPTLAASLGVEPTIDYSGQVIPYSWLDEEDIWTELGDVAQASGARIFVDRNGMVNFMKGHRWARAATPEQISYSQYNEITPVYDDKAFYDEVVVEYADRLPTVPGTKLWELPRAKLILVGAEEEFEARISQPALSFTEPVPNTTYSIRYLNGTDASNEATFTYSEWSAQIVRFKVKNDGWWPMSLSKYAIYGQGLEGQPAEQCKETIATPYHDRRLDVRGNPYVQSSWQAKATAKFLAWWYSSTKMMYDISGLRGSPTLTLGSRLSVELNGGVVTGIVTSLDWTITLTTEEAIHFTQRARILDDGSFTTQSYFMIGTDTLGSTKVIWH